MSTRVSEDQLTEAVRGNIRDGATLDLPYLSMNMLAAVIACCGLITSAT